MESSPHHKLVLKVFSLHCQGCIQTIGAVLTRFPGVYEVGGDWKTKTLVIGYVPHEVDTEAVLQQLKELGYQADGVIQS